ncbi:MAG: alginate lyase family protein, partial [Kiritimatiellales bacterium]
ATLLNVWFLDPSTKMNPNLEYAQGIPGRNTGRGTGIIDTVGFIKVTKAIGWLQGSPECTAEFQQGIKDWFRAYLDWLLTSENGRDEAKSGNNHESWYLAQTAAYALFAGDQERARKALELGLERIAAQIEPDGRQPLELKRTKSYHYSLYNLDALFTLAEFGPAVGVDMFGYRTGDGRSLRAALDYMAPYFQSGTKWPLQEIKGIKQPDELLASLLRRAAIAYNAPEYEEMIHDAKLEKSRFQLLWPR